MIPQSFIQEVLARVDVVEVVGRHVKLKKSGANWVGLCPFHTEKSPSFSVSPVKQFYYCFGCGAHGSAIGFLMEHGALSYVEAIRELAQSVGLQVPDEPGRGRGRRGEPEAPPAADLAAILATAARFYKARLRDSPRAVAYLKARGVSGETARRFGLGYAPEGWRALEAAFADYDAPALVEAGLVVAPEPEPGAGAEGQGAGERGAGGPGARRKRYDRFRDRVMFPIRDARGRTLGFGGRVLDRGEPKYLNSPETALFSKGRELYGLFEARDGLRRTGCAVVVEGYMDVVMLAQHGVDNAVATLGTATTAQHIQKLARLVERVVFAFDGDAAGRKAAWRALEASLPQAQDTRRIDFLFLPVQHDPDSFVREHGQDGWTGALAQAMPLSEFLVRTLAERVDLETSEGRARLQADARPLLQALAAPALRQQLVQRIAAEARIPAADLARYLDEDAAARREPPDAARAAGPARPEASAEDRPRRAWEPRAGGARGRELPAELPRPAPPDAQRRVRALAALYPQMAAQWWQAHAPQQPGAVRATEAAEAPDTGAAVDAPDASPLRWLPAELAEWLRRVARLPPGATYAVLRETLGRQEPRPPELSDAEFDRSVAVLADAELTEQQAWHEFEEAIAKVQLRMVQQAVKDALAARGQPPEAWQDRYRRLEQVQRAIQAQLDQLTRASNRHADDGSG